jgi:hypothetical protein
MSHQRFLLYLKFKGGRFTLKRQDENWACEFQSLLEALQYACELSDDTDARLTVFDETGHPIIETFV